MISPVVQVGTLREWHKAGSALSAGSAFLEDRPLMQDDLAKHASTLQTDSEFEAAVIRLNGFFSLIQQQGDKLYAAVDHMRSIPLFYAVNGGRLFLSDDARWVEASISSVERSPLAMADFLLTSYVTGNETLNPRVKQLQAGEMLVANSMDDSVSVTTRRYFEFLRTDSNEATASTLMNQLVSSFTASMGRLVTIANGRQLVIPLSGGYDSRLIAAYLKRTGYERVLTFTYGRTGNTEARISQKIALALGYDWAFVPYTPANWREWFDTAERSEFFERAHGLTSVPHVQDWPAVWQLKEQGRLDENAIFVPGHAGDFIAGSHTLSALEPAEPYPAEQYAQAVIKAHYRLWPIETVIEPRAALTSRVLDRSAAATRPELKGLEAIALFDRWNWQERQAKFIANSLRVYDFWGYDWWMPMWDKEFVHFWQGVPLPFRLNQQLYTEFAIRAFAAITGWEEEKAGRTDRDSLSAKLLAGVKSSPILPKAFLRRIRNKVRGTAPYQQHPMAWFGIVPEEKFSGIYDGTQSINSFLGAYLLYGEWKAPELIRDAAASSS